MTRLWRSRTVAFFAILLAFALVAAACGDSDEPAATDAPTTTAAPETTTAAPETTTAAPETTTTAAAMTPTGGEVIVADDQEPPTLNSFVPGGDNFIVSIIGQSYFAGVYEIDGFTLELIPELAVELPTVDNGGVTVNDDGSMTVRYQIKDEAVWSDGTPISGADFQFTYDTIMDPDLPIDRTTYDTILPASVVAGDKTFEYTLEAPTVLYEFLFGTIIPKHAVEGSDFLADWNDTMWPSAGPFVLDQWQKGEFVRVVKNDNYWKVDGNGQALPYLDSVVFRFIPETESIINAFKAREVDVIQPPPATETIQTLQAEEPNGAIVEVLSGPVWEHLNFQFGPGRFEMNPESPNESLNYRKAVAHLVDKQLIVDEILAGQVTPLTSFLDPGVPTISTNAWNQYDFNVEKAMEFVEAAKADLGTDTIKTVFSTTSNNDARQKLSELFVGMFEAAGIEYENQLQDSQIFFGETLDNGLWDLGEWAWVGSPGFSGALSLYDLFDPEAPPPDGANYYRWGTPDSDITDDATVAAATRYAEIRDLLNQSVDQEELIPLMQEGEQILADQVVIVPLYARLVTAAVWGDEVGGFKHNPTQASHTWNIEEWYRVDL